MIEISLSPAGEILHGDEPTDHTIHIAVSAGQLGNDEEELSRFVDLYHCELNDVMPGKCSVKAATGDQVAGTWLCSHWGDTGRDCEASFSDDIAEVIFLAWGKAMEQLFHSNIEYILS